MPGEQSLVRRVEVLESTVSQLCSCVSCLHAATEEHILYAQRRCGACAAPCMEILHQSILSLE